MAIVLLFVLLDMATDIPVSARIDMTFPIWSALVAVVAGIVAIIKMNTSIILLKKDFTVLKEQLEKRDEDRKKELGELKGLIYEFVSPHNNNNKHHNGRHH